MGAVKDLYLADLQRQFPTRTYTETVVDSMTDLAMYEAAVAISSVSDVGGDASFNFTPGPTLVVGQEVLISGFIVETNYNGSWLVTATSAGDFEIGEVFTGSEAVGDFEELVDRVRALVVDDAYRTLRDSRVGFGGEIPVEGTGRWVTRPSAALQTTDATATTIDSITLADNTAALVRIQLLSMESDGSDRGGYIKTATFYRDGGGATLQGSIIDQHEEVSDSNWIVTMDGSSNDVRVRVTGSAAQTINWQCVMQYMDIT